MVFSAPVFLFVFLPLCLIAALLAAAADRHLAGKLPGPGRHPVQNLVLLLFSIAFYFYGSGGDIVILFASIVVSYVCGLLIGFTPYRRSVLVVSIVGQLAVLGWFKYANFFVAQVNEVRGALGSKAVAWDAVILPIGISFFVFQGISYTIDVYRRDCAPRKNFLDVALFKALFPQLIAGPIVRYTDVATAIDSRETRVDDVVGGAVRFLYGLCKKVIVADAVAEIADKAFGLPIDQLTTPAALLGAFAYTFQIYFDFSAYSDMAIGLGRMFGFRFPENFRRPLTATSITDFWRRWHMTLSFWFRDYLYLPLGGSRATGWRIYRNLWIVFLLSGLWHGASWTFVIWGAYHGLLLTLERALRKKNKDTTTTTTTTPAWRRFTTFLLVVIGFTIFRAETFTQALAFFRHIALPITWSLPIDLADQLTHKNMLFFVVAAASLLLPASFVTGPWLADGTGPRVLVARFAVLTVGAVAAAALISSNHFSPFIYFRF